MGSMEKLEVNVVTVIGTVAGAFIFDPEVYGEGFYQLELHVERKSGQVDKLPVMVSERLMNVDQDLTGKTLAVMGQLRSYNLFGDGKRKLNIFVFAHETKVLEELEKPVGNEENNAVFLDGFIVKEPTHRRTPLGRDITDLLIAVNRPYGKSDYIPCIIWGRNAEYAARLGVGTPIKVQGRLQSREYVKKLEDGTEEVRTAYELSVSKLNV